MPAKDYGIAVFADEVQFYSGRLEELELPHGSFDYVFSFCVLEHIDNLEEVLRELCRLLKPSGEIHATVDSLSNIDDPEILDKHRTAYRVCRYFRPETIRSVLAEAGFRMYECRHILSSEMARDETVRDLLSGCSTIASKERRREYEKLVDAEKGVNEASGGIMLLCRASKNV